MNNAVPASLTLRLLNSLLPALRLLPQPSRCAAQDYDLTNCRVAAA
jgi:hypothetical protein